jgi:single-strand DNA-binding protein
MGDAEMGSAPAPRSAPPARSAAPAPRAPAAQKPTTGFDDMDDDIPF